MPNNLERAVWNSFPEFIYDHNVDEFHPEGMLKMNVHQRAALSGRIHAHRFTVFVESRMELWGIEEDRDKLLHWTSYIHASDKSFESLCETYGHCGFGWADPENGTEDFDCILCGYSNHFQW